MVSCLTASGGVSAQAACGSKAAGGSHLQSHRQIPLASSHRRMAGALPPLDPYCGIPAAACWPALPPCNRTVRAFGGNAESARGRGAVAGTVDSSTELCVPVNGASPSEPARASSGVMAEPARKAAAVHRQTVDFTMLAACAHELDSDWTPAKIEQVITIPRLYIL